MAANTSPIYVLSPSIQWSTTAMTAANTTKDLTSGTSYLVFTADATNGSYLSYMLFQPLGTNSNATVARIWINNGSTTGTAANNFYFKQYPLPATTNSEIGSIGWIDIPLNFSIPAGYKVYVTLGTAPTSAGWQAGIVGGNY